jgi:hypothetical protein
MTTGAELLVDHLRQRIDVLADRASVVEPHAFAIGG